jgi:toxin ParE1/3/4
VKIVVRPAAAADIEDAFEWYHLKRTELADEFLQALRDAVAEVVDNPEAYPVLHRNTRRIRLRRFPYGLFYRLYPGVIVIVACMHGRRDPLRWKSRR